MFLIGFLVVSLMLLTFVQRAPEPNIHTTTPPAPVVTLPEPEVRTPVDPDQNLVLSSAVQLDIERSLWRQGISFTGMNVREENGVTHYFLPSTFPGDAWYNSLTQDLVRQSSQLEMKGSGAAGQPVCISLQGSPIFFLHFKRSDIKPSKIRPKAQIAIIVDDLGRDLHAVRKLLALDLNLTMAVMPEELHTRESAELSHRAGREILVHMPMEPDSYPQNNPGPGALLLGQDRTEIQSRVTSMFLKVPHAVGGNNHMGSRFTQYPEGMQAVFEVMKEGGWFFVDSRTSPGSIALSEAHRANIASVSRDVFLDNNRNVDAIARQLREAVKIARSRHKVVVICHPYPETIKALGQEAAYLRQQDIQVVPVSRLLQR
ncbi:MAG: divergent polysaccharide deacetylase family protein [Pedobacter sp.]